jgi:hypothetical protein
MASTLSPVRYEFSEDHLWAAESSVGAADELCRPSSGSCQSTIGEPPPVPAAKLADLDAQIRPVASAEIRPADSNNKQRPSLGKRAARGLARFLIIFWTGVAATLAWQSYGDATREMVASSYPQLGWLALQAQTRVETPPDLVAATPSATPSSDPVAPTVPAAPSPDSVAPTAPATPSSDSEQLKAMSLGLAAVQELAAQLVAAQQGMASDIAKLQVGQQDILDKVSSAPPPLPAAAPARRPMTAAPPPSSQTAPRALTVRSSSRSSAPNSFP